DGLADDDEASVLIIPPVVDISLTKTVSNATPRIGEQISFEIAATNNGDITATNIGIEEILPDGYLFISATASIGTYDDLVGFWSIPSLADSGTAVLTLVVEVLETDDYLNTASLAFVDQIDLNIANDSAEATVTPSCLNIFSEFSPNGDGVNEFFQIDCITRFPNNTLKVYNRWGNIVFETEAYANDWDGISNGRAVVNKGEKLPVGTYYYILDLGDGSRPIADWLYINR
ncbi:MAG: gliding motility-associated C-terminal domain-containing protein, partial [Bacteroidota bacterium]